MRIEIRQLIDPDSALAKVIRQRHHQRRPAAVAHQMEWQLREVRHAVVGCQQITCDRGCHIAGEMAGVGDARPVELDDRFAFGGLIQGDIAGFEREGFDAVAADGHDIFGGRAGSAEAILNCIGRGCDPAGDVAPVTMCEDRHTRKKCPVFKYFQVHLNNHRARLGRENAAIQRQEKAECRTGVTSGFPAG